MKALPLHHRTPPLLVSSMWRGNDDGIKAKQATTEYGTASPNQYFPRFIPRYYSTGHVDGSAGAVYVHDASVEAMANAIENRL
jgi:hypothetical protein